MRKYFLLLFLFISNLINSQNEIFTEFNISDVQTINPKWEISESLNWKHIYDEIGWRRIGLNVNVNRYMNDWVAMGGLTNFYTFDKEIDNVYELRPWIGIGLNSKITDKIKFKQQFRTELRNLFFENSNSNSSNGRFRYNITGNFLLHSQIEKKINWQLNLSSEWYIVKNPISGDRFPSSRENQLKVIYGYKNYKFSAAYMIEKFFRTDNLPSYNGQTLVFEFEF